MVGIQVSFDSLSERVEQKDVFAEYFGVAGRKVFAVILGWRDVEAAECVEGVVAGYEEMIAVEDVVESGMEASGMVVDTKIVVVAAVEVVMAINAEMGEAGGEKVAVATKEAVVETEAVSAEGMEAS